MNVLANEIELKLTYTYNKQPVSSLDYAKNLSYKLGKSTRNNNYFEAELNKLISNGILTKVYDIIDNGFREALYNFKNENAQISFLGNDHMSLKLFYSY